MNRKEPGGFSSVGVVCRRVSPKLLVAFRRDAATTARHGFTLVELLVVIAIIGTLMGLLLPAVQNARESGRANNCRSNLSNIQKAMAQYEVDRREYPGYVNQVGGALSAAVKASWSAMILPYIEQKALWEQYEKGEVGAARIDLFICPGNPPQFSGAPATSYLANAGWFQDEKIDEEGDNCSPVENPANGVFLDRTRMLGERDCRDLDPQCQTESADPIGMVNFASVQSQGDGSSNVLMFAEGINAGFWTAGSLDKKWHNGFCWDQPSSIAKARDRSQHDPYEWDLGHRVMSGIRESFGSASTDVKPPNSGLASSFHPSGVNVAFCDGRVVALPHSIDPIVFAQLMTSNRKRSDLAIERGNTQAPIRDRDLPPPDDSDF